jgi:hypothetical protein
VSDYHIYYAGNVAFLTLGPGGAMHREIFAFPRPEKGRYKGREWELLVKPVIEKWGKFVSEYYA